MSETPEQEERTPAPSLAARVPLGAQLSDPGAILDRFLGWVADTGIEPYPAQEEALLELMEGKHVVLATPTGSGKSLVALGLHFKALCEGRRSFYTAPIKALVSEKFFALCDTLGAENVGMLTGDASINWAAPVICCTAEVLSNMALRQGSATDAPYVVMDEFHYYSDRDRGVAWQVPLLTLPNTRFLLMSATLGNTAPIEERITAMTGRECAHVWTDERPVPLDYEYRESPIHETVEKLLDHQKSPIYVVNFTQRECAEIGGALSSARIASRDERERIRDAIGGFRFDSPYGKEMKRLLSHGVGLHHAGLLPKYRLLVEQLSQQGLLKVICGTDTLGVGVNIPIRTVLFSKLAKFDGEKVRILSVRDFKQIAGRAGRKGFDEQGSVVCQAPEHVIHNVRATKKDKARAKGGKGKGKPTRKRSPQKGEVTWGEKTFRTLIKSQPETLISRFKVSHGMLLNVLQRDPAQTGRRGGYGAFIELIDASHEPPQAKRRLRRDAAALVRSLRRAEILHVRDHRLIVEEDLQRNFSLHHTLSLWLVDAVASLDPEEPGYALDVLSLVEAVLEDPRAILFAQVRKLRDALFQQMKAEGVPFEERIEKSEQVTWPKPLAEFIRETFEVFVVHHPWAEGDAVRPKSVAREMVESYASFDGYVREYGLQRIEGLLLRYLGQVFQALIQSVPDAAKTDDIHDVIAYLRTEVARVDSSLLSEWESLVKPDAAAAPGVEPAPPRLDLALTPKAFRARVRAEMRSFVRALASDDLEEASRWLRPHDDGGWSQEELEEALAPFLQEHGRVVFNPREFQADRTVLTQEGPRRWRIQQVLPDPSGEDSGCLEGEVTLEEGRDPEAALVRPLTIRA
ncbi:MAG: DUF3516 domain-containing protein [Myxococcota bacterium]|nr:DUF3516 domain-containing protein [Myxococcota bacterium]